MTTPLTVVGTPEAIGDLVAARIIALVAGKPDAVIGCPSGRTPLPIYDALTRSGADLSRVRVVMMDEYVDEVDGRFRWVDASAPHSCRGFARRHIPVPATYTPDPCDPSAFERLIDDLGGVDLFLLALGATDGHVAFNPPGSAANSVTRVVELADDTRADNMKTFPSFGSIDDVPRYGVSVGLGTIASKSRAAVLIAHGESKRVAMARTLALDGFDAAWPASVIYNCTSVDVVIDAAADPR